MNATKSAVVPISKNSRSKDFPPRLVDATLLDDAEMEETLKELIEYSQIDTFSVRFKADRRLSALCLARSPGNVRKTRKGTVAKYARDMARGAWLLTGEAWKFDVSGRFRDGHHRAQALSTVNAPIDVVLFFGMPDDAVRALDQGEVRLPADVLGVSAKSIAAVRSAMNMERIVSGGSVARGAATRDEVRIALERFAPQLEALGTLNSHPMSMWGVLLLAYQHRSPEVLEFAKQMRANASEDMAPSVRVLREWLLKADTAGQQNSTRVSVYTMYALKAYLTGKSLQRFSPREDHWYGESGIFSWFRKLIGA